MTTSYDPNFPGGPKPLTPAAAAASDPRVLPGPWRPPAPMPVSVGGAPVYAPPGRPTMQQPPQLQTGVVQPVASLEIQEFPSEAVYPSLLHVGPSGHGKSNGMAALCDVGFNVLVVLCEPKKGVYIQRRPNIVEVGRVDWSYAQRYDAIMKFSDDLALGKYRVHNGKPYDAIAIDGLTEIGEYVVAKFENLASSARSKGAGGAMFDFYILIGAKLLGLFRVIRDAAAYASAQAGLPPITLMTTCEEKLGKIGEGINQRVEWLPKLPGQIAGNNVERHFESIWNYETGFNEQTNAFEFRIWTQARPGRMGKSPPIFNACERGPGSYLDVATRKVLGWPHAGVMFARLIADPRSQFYNEAAARRVSHLWK